MSSSFSSGGLIRNFTKRLSVLKRSSDSDFGSGGTEKIMSRNSAERDRRADRVDLLVPAPGQERHRRACAAAAVAVTTNVVSPQSRRAEPPCGSEKLEPRCWMNCCSW